MWLNNNYVGWMEGRDVLETYQIEVLQTVALVVPIKH